MGNLNIQKYISKIPWNTLDTASGKATNVPESLIGLISSDENIRNTSYWNLCQYDICESTYYIISILFHYLNENIEYGKDLIYKLLYKIKNRFASKDILISGMPLKKACSEKIKNGMNDLIKNKIKSITG